MYTIHIYNPFLCFNTNMKGRHTKKQKIFSGLTTKVRVPPSLDPSDSNFLHPFFPLVKKVVICLVVPLLVVRLLKKTYFLCVFPKTEGKTF